MASASGSISLMTNGLVATGHQCEIMMLYDRLIFYAPGLAAMFHPLDIVGDAPVGAHHTVEVVVGAQHFIDESGAETGSDPCRLHAHTYGVVGHQRRCAVRGPVER